jgi:hypothetical protein
MSEGTTFRLRDELQRLFDRDGELSPEQVLAEAKPASSPLHGYFEWNNSAAAAQYRLSQARDLIRRCKVTVETAPETTVRVRAFVNVPDAGYKPVEQALASADRDVVFQQCQREIAALRRKYQNLLDFDAVLTAALTKVQAA